MKLFVLLPSYNEGKALPHLLTSLYEVLKESYKEHEVVVINDGSQDDTENAAKLWEGLLNIKVINHEKNMGLGAAMSTGLYYFYKEGNSDDAVVAMDADNTHNPNLIPLMLEKMKSGSDVVIASRYQHGGGEVGLSSFRRICSVGASMLLSIFFNIPDVKDYTSGYRLYSGSIIKKAYEVFEKDFIEEKGFTCMAEIIIKLHYIRCEISEVPLLLRYDFKMGKSKMKIFKTIKSYLALIYNSRRYRNCLAAEPALIQGKEK